MNSRLLIQHPGEEVSQRQVSALGQVVEHVVTLPAGETLMNAVATVMTAANCDSGVLVLDGMQIGPFDYVMPGVSKDGSHAAWYSDTYSCEQAKIVNATAIVGKREGSWWLHCHALWNTNQSVKAMGHLLPDDVMLATDTQATLYAFTGGCFEVQQDTETNFALFHAVGGQVAGNAFIAKVFPHEDIVTAIEKLALNAGFKHAKVFGIGSLIGTQFDNGEPMLSPISEVLIGPDASINNNTLTLPMHCVDVEGGLFSGNVLRGGAPVTVTFELLIISS